MNTKSTITFGIRFALVGLLGGTLMGCVTTGLTPATPEKAGSPGMPPNYDMPESEFVQGKFATLASEFVDEYAGQYVVFEGTYLGHGQGAWIDTPEGQVIRITDCMAATIGARDLLSGGAGTTTTKVVWHTSDKDLARPFLELGAKKQVKLFCYVAHANEPLRIKSRRDVGLRGFPSPTLVLIKAVPSS